MSECCEYCGTDDRYGHTAVCVMNEVSELRAEIERLRANQARVYEWMREPDYVPDATLHWVSEWINRRPLASLATGKSDAALTDKQNP